MMEPAGLLLEDRGVLEIAGPDAVTFLQGLVSNDVAKVGPARAVYAALLSPQGRYLFDFMIAWREGGLLLESEAARIAELKRRLSLYKLRAKIALSDVSEAFAVAALWPLAATERLGLPPEPGAARAWEGGIAFTDPRLAALGVRALLPREGAAERLRAAGFAPGQRDDYERLRLSLGVPASGGDLLPDKSILLEMGFDELNGIDWQKGCYIGQELTARTKYRGLLRKRLVPVRIAGALPAPGTSISLAGAEVGEMRSTLGEGDGGGGIGLALLRLDAVEQAESEGVALLAGESRLLPQRPGWLAIREKE